jgi:hypothetical protein
MHTYNPLTLPDTISKIIQNQSLEELEKNCWINHTWYNEIKRELRKRWKSQVIKYGELEDEKNKMVRATDILILRFEQFKVANIQIEIEKCMLLNGMLDEQEKEIVKYNIEEISHEEIPWDLDWNSELYWDWECSL